MPVQGHTVLPPDDDAGFRKLVTHLDNPLIPEFVLADGTRISLPREVVTILRDVVEAMAEGQAVTVAPQHTTLTTQQAADLLGVSRPTLVKLLEDGMIPFSKPGRHRRVRLADVIAYGNQQHHARQEGLDELARVSQEHGLYDDEVARTISRR